MDHQERDYRGHGRGGGYHRGRGRGRKGRGHWRQDRDGASGTDWNYGREREQGRWSNDSRDRGIWRSDNRDQGRWDNDSRDRGRQYHEQDRQAEEDGYDSGRRRGRGRHPAGLSGRDIGLWYAQRGKKKAKEMEQRSRSFIKMDSNKERHISNLLATIRAGDNTPPQPSRSYAQPNEEEEFSSVDGAVPSNSSEDGQFRLDYAPNDSWDEPPASWEDLDTPADNTQSKLEGATAFDDVLGDQMDAEYSNVGGGRPNISHTSTTQIESSDSESDDNLPTRGDVPEEDDDEEFMEGDPNEESGTFGQLYHFDKDESEVSEFLQEFYQHREANRRSCERLNDIQGGTFEGLKRIPALDERLLAEFKEKQANSDKYNKMLQFRKKLPSYNMGQEIMDTIKENQVVVISGETGCGKTTQVSQFILDDFILRGEGSRCRVVCTQPRRISAISVAERVADERDERCGNGSSVGYQIRLEHKLSREQGSILYCTTGIMLKWLASDPLLGRTSHVILDEIHERDLHSDFLMIILKDLIRKRRDLKLILMSATLNAEMFSHYFGDCPMIHIPGFTYPVTEYLLEDVIEMTRYNPGNSGRPPPRKRIYGRKRNEMVEKRAHYDSWINKLCHHGNKYSDQTISALRKLDVSSEIDLDLILALIVHIVLKKEDGAILIFLPGWEQIKKLHDKLKGQQMFANPGKFVIIPLHSLMPTVNQREVFSRPPPGVRKIVIATNIAETSITIDDVVYVIDCGKMKLKNFDAEQNISTLEAEPVSRANARQRRGRAGRVQPGECYHLYTAFEEESLIDYQLPEILRTRLEELCLQIKLLKLGKIEPFVRKAMQPPSLESLHLAVQTLIDLNALDKNEDLTPLGFHLAQMPVDPHTGKMLLFGAMFSCLSPILTIAASLSFKDAFYIPMGKEKIADQRRKELSEGSYSDHIMLAKAFEGWQRAKHLGTDRQYCYNNFLSANTLKMLADMRKQFCEILYELRFLDNKSTLNHNANLNSGKEKLVKAVVCAGLYPNVARIKKPKHERGKRPNILETKTERSVRFHPKSVNESACNFESLWVVYHMKMKTTKIYLYDSSVVSPYPLLFFGGNLSVRKESGQDCIIVDDWIIFRSSWRIANLVKELRQELDKLLEFKVTHPGQTNWNPQQKEGAVMQAIMDLITTDDYSRLH